MVNQITDGIFRIYAGYYPRLFHITTASHDQTPDLHLRKPAIMRSLVLSLHSGPFQPIIFTASPFTLASLRPPPALLLISSAVAFPDTATRHRHQVIRRGLPTRRTPFSLVLAASDQEPPPPGDAPESDGTEGSATPDEDETTASDESTTVVPKPRPDEDVTGDNSSSSSSSGSSFSDKEPTELQQETEEGDWDAAWASTRQQMEQKRRDAPAFSGRKEVIATKVGDDEYDIVEISADGSRQRRGDGTGSGGFGFADNGGESGARGRMMDQEQQTVNRATTDKV